MRMWMIDPSLMCRKHLLGEHVEIHMLLGALKKGRSIQGFLDRGLLEPQNLKARHDDLVSEMLSRSWSHSSPIDKQPNGAPVGHVDRTESAKELMNRCEECCPRIEMGNQYD